MSLLLIAFLAGPSAPRALAQANSNPNQITGLIQWNNSAGPVRDYLDTAAHGLAHGLMHSRDTSGVFTGTTAIPDDASHLSAPYSIDVQAGTSVGIADVLGQDEHWFDQGRTILNAFTYDNYRYAFIRPLTQPGYLPCVVASPQVGTPFCNSSGTYSLINVLPTDFNSSRRLYTVGAGFYFGHFRHFEFFVAPTLQAVDVPSVQLGGVVDLGKTFVIDPGFVQGDIYLCGPKEDGITDSPLRHIARTSDTYCFDGDGVPEGDSDMNLYSKVRADGL